MNKLVSGAYGVAIKITGTRLYLPDILELKGKRIKHIDFCDALQKTPNDGDCVSAVLPADQLNGAFFKLMEKNTNQYLIDGLPLKLLALSVNHGNRLFINKIIDFPNSYIDFPALMETPALLNKHIFLVFWYDEPNAMQRIIEGGKTKIQNFEVDIIDSNARRIFFGDNRTLVENRFRNILFFYKSGYGQSPSGKMMIDLSTAQKSFITLQKNNFRFIQNVPVYIFYQINDYFPIRLQNVTFDFLNSYIDVAQSVVLQNGYTWFFNAEIDDND